MQCLQNKAMLCQIIYDLTKVYNLKVYDLRPWDHSYDDKNGLEGVVSSGYYNYSVPT